MRGQDLVYIASGIIPDGYFGDTQKAEFYFHKISGKTICCWGENRASYQPYFTYHTPIAQDAQEALWLLKYHPSSNAKSIMPECVLNESKKQ